MGWIIAIAADGNKAASAQVNGSSGGHILYPGSATTKTSVSLAGGNYELLVLQFDGSNFRVVEATPATASLVGKTIVEFKFRVTMPAVFKRLAEEFGLSSEPVSKYRMSVGALGVLTPPRVKQDARAGQNA